MNIGQWQIGCVSSGLMRLHFTLVALEEMYGLPATLKKSTMNNATISETFTCHGWGAIVADRTGPLVVWDNSWGKICSQSYITHITVRPLKGRMPHPRAKQMNNNGRPLAAITHATFADAGQAIDALVSFLALLARTTLSGSITTTTDNNLTQVVIL